MASTTGKRLLVVLGNQLFPLQHLKDYRDALIFMREDRGLCTYERHHQQKVVLFLAAMRAYRPFTTRVKPEQLFTAQKSARHMLDVIDGLELEDTGGFFAWDGSLIGY